MRGWWIAGVVAAASAWVLLIVVQVVARDALPPDISVSQYGVGPYGWLFSMWVLATGAGPCLVYRYRPVRGLGARWWLLLGLAGAAIMATARTDPGGLQQSIHARIHTGGAVLTLAGLPLGMAFMLASAERAWRRIGVGLVSISAIALELLLLSAAGVDTTGAGAATSWSLWQSVAVAADMLLLVAQAFGALTIPPRREDPEPWWARPRGLIPRADIRSRPQVVVGGGVGGPRAGDGAPAARASAAEHRRRG